MADDFAAATVAPRTFTFEGVDFKVHKLRPRDIGEIEAWMKDKVPNPKGEALIFMKGQSDAVAMHIWDEACKEAAEWPPQFENDSGQALLLTAEGGARLVWVILRRGTPSLTLDQATEIADHMSVEDLNRLATLAMPGDPDSPKSPDSTEIPAG
jgi:hypothetical protein